MKFVVTALSLIVLASCIKTETTKTEIPAVRVPEVKPIQVPKKKGLRCELNGEAERKDVFLHFSEKDGKSKVNIHDFTSAEKISVVASSFDGYKMLSFELEDRDEVRQGTGVLLHINMEGLSNRGKVISITGRITMKADGTSGRLERKFLISHEDKSLEDTEFEELATIERCEKAEASWL